MPLTKIDTGAIKDNAINSAKIADGTVVASDVLDNTITGAKLASDIAISTSGNITTTGALTSTGIDDNASSTAITIQSDGDIGIGTTNPSFISGKGLQIQNSGTATLRLQDDGVHGFEIRASSTEAEFVSANAKPFTFDTGGSERMRIDSSGNVGIGTTSPDYKLQVDGDIVPEADNTYDLGKSSLAWANIYTGDLHLSNEAKDTGNSVDGTKGNWTIQEGENDLYIINNTNGKKYKFNLEEIH